MVEDYNGPKLGENESNQEENEQEHPRLCNPNEEGELPKIGNGRGESPSACKPLVKMREWELKEGGTS